MKTQRTKWTVDTASNQIVIREQTAGNKEIFAFPTSKENAAMIVNAVNAYAVLMEQTELNADMPSYEQMEGYSKAMLITALCAIRNHAQEALKTAKGE
jgi:hypothetical protein